MGTNFYWKETRHEEEDHILQHIGKRSAAGWYCYDCGTTLHRGGTNDVHSGSSMFGSGRDAWHEACPSCGKTKNEAPLTASSAGVELGFASPQAVKPQGVSTCCSFSWTLLKHKWEIERFATTNPNRKIIVDEYGDELSAQEFLEGLLICPIQFQFPYTFS